MITFTAYWAWLAVHVYGAIGFVLFIGIIINELYYKEHFKRYNKKLIIEESFTFLMFLALIFTIAWPFIGIAVCTGKLSDVDEEDESDNEESDNNECIYI